MCEWAEEHDALRWGLLDPARRRRAVNRERKTLFRWHARAAAGLEQQAAKEARLWLPIRGQRACPMRLVTMIQRVLQCSHVRCCNVTMFLYAFVLSKE